MVAPFLFVIVDEDQATYSVHGPMSDDTRWTDAVWAAQQRGRTVRCFTTRVEAELAPWSHQHRLSRVNETELPWGDLASLRTQR